MKTLLYDKTSVESMRTVFSIRFRKLFTLATGYDLMFEESRTDIEVARPATTRASL